MEEKLSKTGNPQKIDLQNKSSSQYRSYIEDEDEIDLYELWLVLKRRKNWVLGGTFVGILVSVLYCLYCYFVPVYKTKFSIVPIRSPIDNQEKLLLLSNNILLISLPHIRNDIIPILDSRSLREEVIKRLNLLHKLFPDKWDSVNNKWKGKPPTLYEGEKKLKKLIKISRDRFTRAIVVTVEFKKDPQTCYKIANTIIQVAKELISKRESSVWLECEKDIQEKLLELKEVIKEGEQLYKTFLKRFHLDKKTKKFLEEQKAFIKRSRLDLMQHLGVLKKELEDIKRYLKRGVHLDKLPDLKQLKLKIEIASDLYKGLLAEYQLVKLQEIRKSVPFQIIDPPYVPQKPINRKFALIISVGLISGIFLGIFLAFFKEWLQGVRERYENFK